MSTPESAPSRNPSSADPEALDELKLISDVELILEHASRFNNSMIVQPNSWRIDRPDYQHHQGYLIVLPEEPSEDGGNLLAQKVIITKVESLQKSSEHTDEPEYDESSFARYNVTDLWYVSQSGRAYDTCLRRGYGLEKLQTKSRRKGAPDLTTTIVTPSCPSLVSSWAPAEIPADVAGHPRPLTDKDYDVLLDALPITDSELYRQGPHLLRSLLDQVIEVVQPD